MLFVLHSTGAEYLEFDIVFGKPHKDFGATYLCSAAALVSVAEPDVAFDQPFSGTAPSSVYVQRVGAPSRHPELAFGLAFAALAVAVRRRARG